MPTFLVNLCRRVVSDPWRPVMVVFLGRVDLTRFNKIATQGAPQMAVENLGQYSTKHWGVPHLLKTPGGILKYGYSIYSFHGS